MEQEEVVDKSKWLLLYCEDDTSFSLIEKGEAVFDADFLTEGDKVKFFYGGKEYDGEVCAMGGDDDYDDLLKRLRELNAKNKKKDDSFHADRPRKNRGAGKFTDALKSLKPRIRPSKVKAAGGESSKVVKKKVSGKAVESRQVKKASGKAVKLSDSTSSEESQTGSSSGSSSPPPEELLPGEVRKTAQSPLVRLVLNVHCSLSCSCGIFLNAMARKCAWCGESYGGDAELLAHVLERHAPSSSVEEEKKSSGGVARFKCDLCDKTYKTKNGLCHHKSEVHKAVAVKCDECEKVYKNKRQLARHVKLKHSGSGKYKCDACSGTFFRSDELKLHQRMRCGSRLSILAQKRKGAWKLHCAKCNLRFKTSLDAIRHRRVQHPQRHARYVCADCGRVLFSRNTRTRHFLACEERKKRRERYLKLRSRLRSDGSPQPLTAPWETRSAVQGKARIHLLEVSDQNDLQLTLIKNKETVLSVLKSDIVDLKQIKWYMSAYVRVKEGDKEVSGDDSIKYMRCPPVVTLRVEEVESQIKDAILGVLNSYERASGEGSQILFGCVEKIELRVVQYSPLKGSSYLPLPSWLENPKKGLINIKNFDDNKCFMYCIMAGINLPNTNPERVSHYKRWDGLPLNFKGIKFPVEVGQISKFERQNPSIAVSVFGLEGEREIIPLRISKVSDRKYHVRMLLLRTEEDESHYVLIKNMSQFLGHLSKRKRVLYWCDNCLTPTDSEDRRNQHQELCLHHAAQAVRLPCQKDAVMKFTNYGNMERHDFVIYADLESILVPYDTAFPDPSKSSSTKTQVHKAFGFSYIIVGQNGEFVKPPVVGHGGDDVIERFLLALKKEEEEIEVIRGVDYPIDMTPEKLFPDAEKQSLLRRKGVYPYSYFQSEEQFLETCIPPKECFTSDLTTEEISEEDYEHALKVFKIFDMKNLYDYHDLYILLDTVLLSCVFEAFRRLAMKNYHLDPAFYFSLPGLSWDAALLYTGVKLELITDMETHLMWEKSIRGGVATINERLMECNNPYVSGYDPSKESVYLLYLDANNLYGYSLSRKLPTHGFRFLSTEEIECLDISKLSENDSTGYLFEVTLRYPSRLHDLHNDFPLAPEHREVHYDELSPLQKKILKKNGLPKHSTKKLIPTLERSVCLDLAKELMYDFYYNVLKAYYGDRVTCGGSDTDSLILSIKTNDVYQDMLDYKDHLDTSDYPQDHFLYSTVNKKVIGKFKDELNGTPLRAMAGLGPKMYSILEGESEKCVAKGVPRVAVKTQLRFDDYKNCILTMKPKNVTFSKISSDQKHHVYTTFSSRRGLSCFDNKRYILSDNIKTLAYGHILIKDKYNVSEWSESESEDV
ncbi:Zinc finger protein 397 [Frankliniella fusca]|uniref:Zinc finger protein 397 n=1 Tax=Frankliniella fusca TaxID=407009 RepID=A0AAE1HWC5_9NEOP|nr:Zinc finger protein 397 [Frankliniella fusca]